MADNQRPTIALTMGDVAGIGPEIVARAVTSERIASMARPVVVGHPRVLERALRLIDSSAAVEIVSDIATVGSSDAIGRVLCWNPSGDGAADVPAGKVDARAGRAAHDYLVAATQAALAGDIDAITTAPLNKAALALAGLNFPGHTEILAKVCGVDRFAMMLYLPAGESIASPLGLGVAHVTLHTSIASVPGLLDTASIVEKIRLVSGFMMSIGCGVPRIAVCALNPHAGEDGLFGDEESRIIAPAVVTAADAGINVNGPLPADTLIRRAVLGEFDGVVAMYHDQGHIPFKLIGFDRAVNITLGLPVVRTSPSHGTAFDIAWTGRAKMDGFTEAVEIATRLCRAKSARR